MDYIKVIDLIINNPANNLTTTSVGLLVTMKRHIQLTKEVLPKADVSERSELLKAFAKRYNEQHNGEISETFIDDYVKNL
jgi:hypothetical protein